MRRFHPHIFITEVVIGVILFLTNIVVVLATNITAGQEIEDKKEVFCNTMDTEAPEITLIGDDEINLTTGAEYNDAGVEVVDYCGAELKAESNIDTSTAGEYRMKYTATDRLGNTTVLRRKVYVRPAYRGTIYLTFDDGPGDYTGALLDVLKKYNVKATFFVTGAGDDYSILREYQEGHAIGLHTWSHSYAYLYESMDNFFADLDMIQERVERITGEKTYLMRFPGGSSNTVSTRYDGGTHIMSRLAAEVERRGYTYFDWNISSGDAGGANTTEQVYSRVVNSLVEGGSSVVLQHDIKGFSVEAVEGIIQYGLNNGYVFDKLSSDSFAAHHGINN